MAGTPLAALIVGKKPASAPPPADAGAPAAGGSATAVASDLLDAIAAKDPGAVAAAMQAFCDLHESGEPGATPPE
jgi:hypothetical protein